MTHALPDLPYATDAIEPHVDARTMEIHHGKHHAGYVANLNKAIDGTDRAGMDVGTLLRSLGELPEDIRAGVRNNAGGHWNHSLFWTIMGPSCDGEPEGDLAAAIDGAFGSFASFQEQFAAAAATRFGSGWAWLCVGSEGELAVCSTANQDNPTMGDCGCNCAGWTPILGLDVWEHAYYLNYQNRRPDYVSAWWNVVNWVAVAELHAKALAGQSTCCCD